jgi:integrase
MPKSGQARVLTPEQQAHVFEVIQKHRYPEKNTAIMQLSFKLGLRVQEIALLQFKEVCDLGRSNKKALRQYSLWETLSLPASYTKGSDAMKRSRSKYIEKRSMTFNKEQFDKIILQVEALAKAGAYINPENFYPAIKKHQGTSRDLPMVDESLREALSDYLDIRLLKDPSAKPTDPLFITQKGGSYSPNTLQEHMAMILRRWAGIEKASSHSGRRTMITDIIHSQRKTVKVAQKIAGHVNPATTIIYEDPPEQEIKDALGALGKNSPNKT